MLNKLNDWCSKWRLSINCDKTKIIHFRPASVLRCNDVFSCGHLTIDQTEKYKYLGLWFQEHLDLQFATSELAKSASRALSVLHAKFKCAGGMSYEVYTKLYTSLVEPILYYCAGIWGLTEFSKIKTVQNTACRLFLGVGKNAANLATRGDMGWADCFVNQRLETCRLFCKLTNIQNERLVKRIFIWSKSHGKCWEKRFLKFINDIELSHLFDQDTVCVAHIIKLCKSKLVEKDKSLWRTNLFNDNGHQNGNKLRTYRLYKTDLETECYVTLSLQRDHRRILAMFRCGNLPLHIETGRYARPKLPVEQRTCFHCIDTIEDELHFLIDCPFYDDIRRNLFRKAQLCNRDFILYDSTAKMIFLLNNINMQPILASTLFDMFQRRKRTI